MTTLVLPIPPSANRYWRTRVMHVHGKPVVSTYVSPEATAFKREVAKLAMLNRCRQIVGPVEMRFTLYPHRPQDWATRARKDPNGWQYTVQSIDLDNASKVLVDALKGIAFEDDRWLQRYTGERAVPDGNGARVVVTVAPFVAEIAETALNLPLQLYRPEAEPDCVF